MENNLKDKDMLKLMVEAMHRMWESATHVPIILYCPMDKDPSDPNNWKPEPITKQ